MAIIDLYNNSKADYKNAGAGVSTSQLEQQWVANKTFDTNLTPADKNKTEFSMVDTKANATNAKFNSYDINDDYYVGNTKVSGYNPTKVFNGGALTNPKG